MFYKALVAGVLLAAVPESSWAAPYIVTYEEAGVEIDRFRLDTAAGRENLTPGYATFDLTASARGYDGMFLLLNEAIPAFGIGNLSENQDNVFTEFGDIAYNLYAGDGFNLNVSGPTSFATSSGGRLIFREAAKTNLQFTISQDGEFVESFVIDPNLTKEHYSGRAGLYDVISSSRGANAVFFSSYARDRDSPLSSFFGIGEAVDGLNAVAEYYSAETAGGIMSKFGDTMNVVAGDSFDLGGGRVMTISAVDAVPEPATWGLMCLGFGMVGLGLRRRKQARVTFA